MLSNSDKIKDEIIKKFGFMPPFFEPAFDNPQILENLWNQTVSAYLENPLPDLFKERLAALLARYCSVPYCLMCHSASLRPLGMNASDVLSLLQLPALGFEELANKTEILEETLVQPNEWPDPNSETELGILYCCVAIFLNQDTSHCLAKLRAAVGSERFEHIVMFIAYNRTCLQWAEAHPELSSEADKRVQSNMGSLLEESLELRRFFDNYQSEMKSQADRRTYWLTQEYQALLQKEHVNQSIIKDNEEWLSATLRGIGDAVLATDAEMPPNITFLNSVAEKLTGWKLDQAKGRPVSEVFNIINEQTREPAINPILNVLATGEIQTLANHTKLIARDNCEFIIEDSAAPIRNSKGDINGVVLVFRDVTAQTRAEKEKQIATNEILQAQENLREFFMQAPLPMVILEGADHHFTLANPPYEDFIGRKATGRKLDDVFLPGEITDFVPLLDKVFSEGISVIAREMPLHLYDEKGKAKDEWINIHYHPHKDGRGNTKGVLAVVQDITSEVNARLEIQNIADSLADERLKLETMFHEIPAGLALLKGPTLTFEVVNSTWKSFRRERDYLGRPFAEVYPELKDEEVHRRLSAVFETGHPFIQNEMYSPTETEKSVVDQYFDCNFKRISDSYGRPYGVFAYAVDVTQRVSDRSLLERSQSQLKAREEQLASAIEVSNIGFFDWNISSNQISFSDKMQKVWGLKAGGPLEEVLSRLHPEDQIRVAQLISESVNSNVPYFAQYRVIRPDRQEIWIEARGKISFDKGGKPVRFFGTSLDITKRKQASLEIENAKRDAEHSRDEAELANETKSSFLANMSHEIRTPLGVIIGYTELLRDERVARDERLQFVDVINRNAKSLTRIIDDILDLSKVEAGRLAIELSPMSLKDLINDVALMFQDRARTIGIQLSTEIEPSVAQRIISDSVRLRQILINIVGNAVKFTEVGSVKIVVSSKKVADQLDEFLIVVRDTGRGLTEEQKAKLFRPFVQADSTTTREFGGTGLGLVLSRKLASALGGDIQIGDCAPREGCSFLITFRAVVAANQKLQDSRSGIATVTGELPLQNLRILLVEDSVDNQFLIKRLLVRHGANVTIADNGQIGFSKAISSEFDVVLMDIQMPVMDGYTAMKKLALAEYKKPVIALTAHAMEDERRKTSAAGFSAHVTKPVEVKSLIATINSVLLNTPHANDLRGINGARI